MCFDNDHDWYASLSEDTTGPATESQRCDECRTKSAIGETCRRIYQQEHEECRICENDCSDEFIDRGEMEKLLGTEDDEWARSQIETLHDHKHDYGETYEYYCCEACDKVRRAVVAREKQEGCPNDSQQPALGELWEALGEHDDRAEYAKHALAMFPELTGLPWLMRLLEERE